MAKKAKHEDTAAVPTQSMVDSNDDWKVRDGVNDAMRYHALTADKPLFRKVRNHVRKAHRMMSRKGGR